MKRNPVSEMVVLSNPRGRRRKSHARRRRNPGGVGGIFGGIVPMLKEGAVGAAGALATDVAYGFAKKWMPEAVQSGYGRSAAKLGLAAAVAWALNRVMPGRGRAFAAGAATVIFHELGTKLLNENAPQVPLGAYEDTLLGWDSAQPVSEYMGQGAYMQKQSVGDLLPQ